MIPTLELNFTHEYQIGGTVDRAVRAYLRSDPEGVRPDIARSAEAEASGLRYVVLRDAKGARLAVYRVRLMGEGRTMLKRLRARIPAELEA